MLIMKIEVKTGWQQCWMWRWYDGNAEAMTVMIMETWRRWWGNVDWQCWRCWWQVGVGISHLFHPWSYATRQMWSVEISSVCCCCLMLSMICNGHASCWPQRSVMTAPVRFVGWLAALRYQDCPKCNSDILLGLLCSFWRQEKPKRAFQDKLTFSTFDLWQGGNIHVEWAREHSWTLIGIILHHSWAYCMLYCDVMWSIKHHHHQTSTSVERQTHEERRWWLMDDSTSVGIDSSILKIWRKETVSWSLDCRYGGAEPLK